MRNSTLQLNGSALLLVLLTHKAAEHLQQDPQHIHPILSTAELFMAMRGNQDQGHRAVPVCRGYHCRPDPTPPTLFFSCLVLMVSILSDHFLCHSC